LNQNLQTEEGWAAVVPVAEKDDTSAPVLEEVAELVQDIDAADNAACHLDQELLVVVVVVVVVFEWLDIVDTKFLSEAHKSLLEEDNSLSGKEKENNCD
jgi:hypothetical protein